MKVPESDVSQVNAGKTTRSGGYVLYVSALLFLAFIGGALAAVAGIFPATYVETAYRAGKALHGKFTARHDPLASDLWPYARANAAGLLTADYERKHSGFTLFTTGDGARAHLIAPSGAVIHEWKRPYSGVWDKSGAVRAPMADNQVYFRKARLYPNGDILVIYEGVGDSPYGYGMARLDRDSNLIWKNLDHFHHDFHVADDGLIYGLTHAYRQDLMPDVDHLKPPYLDDFVVVVSPDDGRMLKKISLIEAFRHSDYRRMLWLVPYYSLEDPLHTNSVRRLEGEEAEQLAAKVPQAKEGRVLLSLREMGNGVIALLDLETERIVWATRGPWHAQHDVDVLPNGNLLLFDNRGHFGPGGQSRIIEVDAATGAIEWIYAGDERNEFESLIRGSQERLPNGNTLITESQAGRLLEVTEDGEIVWEYVTPVRAGKASGQLPIVSYGQRIELDALDPDFAEQLLVNLQAKEMESE